MAMGMQTVTEVWAPFKNMVADIGQGIQDSFVTTSWAPFVIRRWDAVPKQALESFAQSLFKEMTAMTVNALALYLCRGRSAWQR